MATETRSTWCRWMTARDIPAVVAMGEGWNCDDYLEPLRQRNVIGMVIEHNDTVLGAVLYELHKGRLEVLRIVVRPDARRLGVGAALVEKLVYKCASHRRDFIAATVPEDNLDAQLFFRANGFWAVGIGEGGYIMERYVMPEERA